MVGSTPLPFTCSRGVRFFDGGSQPEQKVSHPQAQEHRQDHQYHERTPRASLGDGGAGFCARMLFFGHPARLMRAGTSARVRGEAGSVPREWFASMFPETVKTDSTKGRAHCTAGSRERVAVDGAAPLPLSIVTVGAGPFPSILACNETTGGSEARLLCTTVRSFFPFWFYVVSVGILKACRQ